MSTKGGASGHPRYLPPECETGSHVPHSAKGDVYASGCVFIETFAKYYAVDLDLRETKSFRNPIPKLQRLL